jgi:hypothetical protein
MTFLFIYKFYISNQHSQKHVNDTVLQLKFHKQHHKPVNLNNLTLSDKADQSKYLTLYTTNTKQGFNTKFYTE